jgi:hypothetical protein
MNEWQNEATRVLVLYSTPSEIKLTDQFYYHTTPSHLCSSTIPTEHSHTAPGRREEALRKTRAHPTPRPRESGFQSPSLPWSKHTHTASSQRCSGDTVWYPSASLKTGCMALGVLFAVILEVEQCLHIYWVILITIIGVDMHTQRYDHRAWYLLYHTSAFSTWKGISARLMPSAPSMLALTTWSLCMLKPKYSSVRSRGSW